VGVSVGTRWRRPDGVGQVQDCWLPHWLAIGRRSSSSTWRATSIVSSRSKSPSASKMVSLLTGHIYIYIYIYIHTHTHTHFVHDCLMFYFMTIRYIQNNTNHDLTPSLVILSAVLLSLVTCIITLSSSSSTNTTHRPKSITVIIRVFS